MWTAEDSEGKEEERGGKGEKTCRTVYRFRESSAIFAYHRRHRTDALEVRLGGEEKRKREKRRKRGKKRGGERGKIGGKKKLR